MKTVVKRVLSVLLSITVVFSILVSTEQKQVFAAPDNVLHSLNLWNADGSHGSGNMTVWKNGSTSVSAPQILYGWFGNPADSYSLFCIDYGKVAKTGDAYATQSDYDKLNAHQQEAIGYVLGCARIVQAPRYNGSFNEYGGDVTWVNWRLYNSTQLMIWYYIDKYYTPGANEGIGWEGVVLTCNAGWGDLAECERIKGIVDNIFTVPSFTSENPTSAPTYKLTYNSATGMYETILQDTNPSCTIGKFSWSGSGLTFTRCNASGAADANGTYLKVSASTPIAASSATVTTNQYEAQTGNITYVKNQIDTQDLVLCTSSRPDPVPAYMNIYTESALQISKQDVTTSAELPGCSLSVTSVDGKTVYDSWVSGDTPHMIYGLASGTYKLNETMAKDGYTKANSITFNYNADSGLLQKVVMTNELTTTEISKLGVDGKALPGATLELRKSDGTLLESWVSDEKPHTIKGLLQGNYVLREVKAPEGYTIAEEVTFSVTQDNAVQSVSMVDTLTEIEFMKVDENGNLLSGATLGIYDADGNIATDYSGKAITSWITDGKPHTIKGLPVGNYILRELDAPEGWTVAEDVAFTVTDELQTVRVTMENKETEVEFIKEDGAGNPLSGATLQVLDADGNEVKDKDGKVIASWVSGETAHVINGLPAGSYILRELEAPAGWTVAEDVAFTVTDELQTVRVTMENKETEVEFIKEDGAGNPLSGATLQVLDTDGNEVKDKDGKVIASWVSGEIPHVIKGLLVGNYILRELKAPAGWTIAEDVAFTVTDELQTVRVTMENKETEVEIIKEDGAGNPLSGATLQVLDADGNEIKDKDGKVIASWVSGETAHVIEGLPAGNYILRELEAPAGWTIAEDVAFTVTDELQTVQVTMQDESVQGRLRIFKTGDQVVSAKEYTAVYGTFKRLTFEQKPLEGVVFEVYQEDGTLIETITTDADGYAETDILPWGEYYIIETETPAGLVNSGEKIAVELTCPEDYHEAIYIKEVEVTNVVGDTEINVYKQGEILNIEDGTYSFGTKPLEGVIFGVYANEDILDYDNNVVIQKDECIGFIKTGDDGKAALKDALVEGNYYYKEVQTLEGYILDETKREFSLILGNEELNTMDVNKENPDVNQLYKTKLQIVKSDNANRDVRLSGVEFELYNSKDELMGVYITDENGQIIIDGLPYGTYYFKETKTAEGYVIDTSKQIFEAEAPEQTLNITNAKTPVTGDNVIPLWIVACALGLSGGCCFYFLKRSAKKK